METRRERQAEQTRRDITAAARALFARQGYAGTSVAQIAEAAGVSVQTIYDSVGSKSAIVGRLNDLIDEEGDVAAIASRIPTLEDPVDLLDVPVSISRNINERCGDIAAVVFAPSAGEPALEAIRDEGLRRHREGCARLVGRLAAMGALRDGLEPAEAAAVVAGLTEPVVARMFVLGYGWSWDQWHRWTRESLAGLVLRGDLGPPADPKPSRARRRR